METLTPRVIVSRRARPAKAPLSREVIAAAALKILEQDGLDGLSLRKVASALDTGAASLYVYFKNLQELHAVMLDQALVEVKIPKNSSTPWRDRLKAVMASYLVVLYRRRGLAQLAMTASALGKNTLRITECILGLLREAGIESGRVAWGYDLLTLSVTAIAAEQSNRDTEHTTTRPEDILSMASKEEFPLTHSLQKEFFSGDEASRVDWALDVIINGVINTSFPPSDASAKQMKKLLKVR